MISRDKFNGCIIMARAQLNSAFCADPELKCPIGKVQSSSAKLRHLSWVQHNLLPWPVTQIQPLADKLMENKPLCSSHKTKLELTWNPAGNGMMRPQIPRGSHRSPCSWSRRGTLPACLPAVLWERTIYSVQYVSIDVPTVHETRTSSVPVNLCKL